MTTQSECSCKIDLIIAAAQHRLGLYGYEKTTMSEIARDIAMSKASLYYYFPDKESLFKAVLEKEQSEFFLKIEKEIKTNADPEQMLIGYVNLRINYLKTFMNLSKFRNSATEEIKPLLKDLIMAFWEKELAFITMILEKGIQSGLFYSSEPKQDALMFLNILKGLRFSMIRQKPFVELSAEEHELLSSTAIKFTSLFIRGLKNKQ